MAGKEHHIWVPGQEPPKIRPHSLAKHRVIAGYLRRYVDVVAANRKQPELKLTLVDGFAGGGIYRDELTLERRDGSPILMLRAMDEAARAANEQRSKTSFNLDVEYYFIEKSPVRSNI